MVRKILPLKPSHPGIQMSAHAQYMEIYLFYAIAYITLSGTFLLSLYFPLGFAHLLAL